MVACAPKRSARTRARAHVRFVRAGPDEPRRARRVARHLHRPAGAQHRQPLHRRHHERDAPLVPPLRRLLRGLQPCFPARTVFEAVPPGSCVGSMPGGRLGLSSGGTGLRNDWSNAAGLLRCGCGANAAVEQHSTDSSSGRCMLRAMCKAVLGRQGPARMILKPKGKYENNFYGMLTLKNV